MAEEVERTEAGRHEERPGTTTWIWSDLHLHHRNIIRYCRRPFASREEMDEALIGAWRETVAPADTVVCVGDVALQGSVGQRRRQRLAEMPGRKLLVLGNHDFDHKGRPGETASDERWMTLVIPGAPLLVLTHFPLGRVPADAVNVHGHSHNNGALRTGPYVNVCVEHTGYRPLALADVRRVAQARLEDPRPRAETTLGELEGIGATATP